MARRRIFIGFVEIAGFCSSLKEGFEALGHRVTFVTADRHIFGYGGDSGGLTGRLTTAWVRKEWEVEPWGAWERLPGWARAAARWLLVTWLGLRHDWFIFPGGRSLEGNGHAMARQLLRMGCKVAFLCCGSESRPRFVDGTGYADRDETPVTSNRLATETRTVRDNVHEMHASASFVVDNPVSAQFHPRAFVNWYSIGIPTRTDATMSPPARYGPTVRLLHSPSYPRMKGTPEIRRAVAKLIAEGWPLEYTELSGVPNAEVLRQIQECDIVMDQLYSDTPMAGFAREAALLGKPSIVGGYGFWDHGRSTMSEAEWPPSLLCRPEEFESTLRTFLQAGRPAWETLGTEARTFILRQWKTEDCAARLAEAFEKGPRSEWLVDPTRMNYLWGCGLTTDQVREMSASLILSHGESALCLEDKPHLLKQYAALARPIQEKIKTMTDESIPDAVAEHPLEGNNCEHIARNLKLQQRIRALELEAQELVKLTPEQWTKLGTELSSVVNRLGMIRRRDEKIAKLEAKVQKWQAKR